MLAEVRSLRPGDFPWSLLFFSGLVALAALFAGFDLRWNFRCPFQLVFKLPCPGCGLTRMGMHLARGSLGQALAMHPLGAVGTLALALHAGLDGLCLLRGKKLVLGAWSRRRGTFVLLVFAFFTHWIFTMIRGIPS
jgi:hypothetical protein